jgi:anti-sigma regulatory factor (Ser/Thr protein kinase)
VSTAINLAGALHEAILYSEPDELAERLVPRLRPSLDDGGPVVAVLDERTRAEVRRLLGGEVNRVDFPDPAFVHRLPPFTVALRWARLSRRVDTPTGRATVVGQHVAGLPGCGATHWARLDIGLNVAVVGLPITVLCPYRADDEDIPRVRATHPRLTTADGSVASSFYRQPTEALVEYPPPPPPELGPSTASTAFAADRLGALRHLVAEVAGRGGMDPDRVADLVLAVNEIAANSIEHGPGYGRLRIWATDEAVVAEVSDSGTVDLPFPGMVAPAATGVRGRGMWLASELCDVMQVWSYADATVVRLRMDHLPQPYAGSDAGSGRTPGQIGGRVRSDAAPSCPSSSPPGPA